MQPLRQCAQPRSKTDHLSHHKFFIHDYECAVSTLTSNTVEPLYSGHPWGRAESVLIAITQASYCYNVPSSRTCHITLQTVYICMREYAVQHSLLYSW